MTNEQQLEKAREVIARLIWSDRDNNVQVNDTASKLLGLDFIEVRDADQDSIKCPFCGVETNHAKFVKIVPKE